MDVEWVISECALIQAQSQVTGMATFLVNLLDYHEVKVLTAICIL